MSETVGFVHNTISTCSFINNLVPSVLSEITPSQRTLTNTSRVHQFYCVKITSKKKIMMKIKCPAFCKKEV